ncbi:unnamed protein product [Pleuronectes platessa]|uniref:Uncharacterized protein n=1 Tax=Pleuronectes platessa TaxID=8262 RepID=A0A9N7TNP1_PLEPL|nr:unnamed protein product [Pleuronectes platessa]
MTYKLCCGKISVVVYSSSTPASALITRRSGTSSCPEHVHQADVCTQDVLLQNTDVLVMNNVFEYFMEPSEQIKAWRYIMKNLVKTGSLLVTVPSLQESLAALQEALRPGWVEELPVDYDVDLGRDTDPEALRQIHLYRVM